MEWVAQLACAASESKQPRRVRPRQNRGLVFSTSLSLPTPLSFYLALSYCLPLRYSLTYLAKII